MPLLMATANASSSMLIPTKQGNCKAHRKCLQRLPLKGTLQVAVQGSSYVHKSEQLG